MPSDERETADSPLLAGLRARIEREGPLRVDQYMAACVADPQHGYWHKGASIGAEGDFITAPEVSQIFGELIGLWSVVAWQNMGRPAPLRLIELGPGRGTLMRDALRAARAMPAFLAASQVHLVEISGPLRETQQRALLPRDASGDRPAIAWHTTLSEVPEGPAIVIANEFLDALPIRQFVYADDAWRERVVAIDAQGALCFAVGPKVDECEVPDSLHTGEPRDGDMLEVRAGETEVLAQLRRRSHPVVALFVDYGPAEAAIGDTLQAVRGHRYVDPLATPGSADLTAHVRFAALASAAEATGLAVDGPLTQAEFLGRLGASERATRLMAANPQRAADIEAGLQRIMSPTGMGGLFKVMTVRTRGLPPPPPFR